jgi:3-deoxy-D-manno-octulosonic-acid transferase
LLLDVRGGRQVADAEELEAAVQRLIEDTDLAREMGRGGHTLLEQNAGATAHTVKTLVKVMGGRG